MPILATASREVFLQQAYLVESYWKQAVAPPIGVLCMVASPRRRIDDYDVWLIPGAAAASISPYHKRTDEPVYLGRLGDYDPFVMESESMEQYLAEAAVQGQWYRIWCGDNPHLSQDRQYHVCDLFYQPPEYLFSDTYVW